LSLSNPSYDPRNLYLSLMKRVLTNWVYSNAEDLPISNRGLIRQMVTRLFASRRIRLVIRQSFNPETRTLGRDFPSFAHTMVGIKRLDNVQDCIDKVIEDGVPGDFIETGVWRGGTVIFMRAVLKAYGITDRRVWVADSFAGLPPPSKEKYPLDRDSTNHLSTELAIPIEEVKANFEKYDLLDDQVKFLKGWFRDTLPAAPIEKLAVMRLDGDMYESTTDALSALYPRLSVGGFVIVDDYGTGLPCRQAVHDFRDANGIKDEIIDIDGTGVYWRRG
jgi:O-methyltransferase